MFVLNNIICTVSNCVKRATINQGCDYLVGNIRNIDVKLHHLVQIWARVSASAHLKGNAQMPIAWRTPSWDGLMTGSDWLESLMDPCLPSAILPDMKSLMRGYGRNHCIYLFIIVSVVPVMFPKSWWCSDLIAYDNWLKSKQEKGERCKVVLHYSYSRADPWYHVSE